MRDIKNHLEEASGTMVAATSRLVAPCGSGSGRTPPWARLPSDPGSACGASGLRPALPGRDPPPGDPHLLRCRVPTSGVLETKCQVAKVLFRVSGRREAATARLPSSRRWPAAAAARSARSCGRTAGPMAAGGSAARREHRGRGQAAARPPRRLHGGSARPRDGPGLRCRHSPLLTMRLPARRGHAPRAGSV